MANPGADTTFACGTVITDDWLNAINDFFYDLFEAATTPAEARAALGIYDRQWCQWAVTSQAVTLETGTALLSVPMPAAGTFLSVQGFVSQASTSGNVVLDITKNGVSILSTTITIEQDEQNSLDAATQPVISTATFVAGDIIAFNVTSAGVGASGAVVTARIEWDWVD